MRADKKAARDKAKALEGLKAMLLEDGAITEEEAGNYDSLLDNPDYNAKEKSLFQAEGMLRHLKNLPNSFITKKCEQCGEFYRTSYVSVAYCSDPCRAKAFEKQMGVKWHYSTDHYQNLRVERPLLVGPECYKILLEFARDLLDQHNVLVQEAEEVEKSDELDSLLMDAPHTTPVVSPPPSTDLSESLEDLLGLFE